MASPAAPLVAERPLLRLATAGSVDDGKSTLIGRLLYDSQQVLDDQMSALTKDSEAVGTRGDQIDFALLVDGLAAEREQGITIDVAYRYFSTARRNFIIADTPGHIQYTRNMVTGASTADLALVLVDARKGLVEQSRRHAFLATLARMKQVVVTAVHGVAAGAGLSLAMLADFRIAAPTAKFTTAFAGIGLSCDTGASWSLQRLVGSARARELLFDARTIDADEALRIGLVNRIEDDALAAAVAGGCYAGGDHAPASGRPWAAVKPACSGPERSVRSIPGSGFVGIEI